LSGMFEKVVLVIAFKQLLCSYRSERVQNIKNVLRLALLKFSPTT